jgi:transcriptional regulator with XRE-family HTH domain
LIYPRRIHLSFPVILKESIRQLRNAIFWIKSNFSKLVKRFFQNDREGSFISKRINLFRLQSVFKLNKARKMNLNFLEELRNETSPQMSQQISKRMKLAAQIDDVLMSRGLTNQEFAFMMGKKPSEITRWLSGTHNFTTETLWEIERVLNIQLLTSSVPAEKVMKETEELRTFIADEVQKALIKFLSKRKLAI